MKKFLYSLRADLLFSEPVSNHTFVLRSVPLSEPGQEPMRISLTCQPGCRLSETFDGQGNKVFLGSIENKHTFFSFCSTGEVLVDSSQRQQFRCGCLLSISDSAYDADRHAQRLF